jgi:molybdenum cofactor guanylyltransferase
MSKKEYITGIVLAGGKSSRMGQDKGLMLLQGKAMVLHVIEQLQPQVAEVLLVANAPAYQQFGFRVVPDLVAEAGPMGGIYTGLTASASEYTIVLSCDMPFISAEAVRYLIEHAREDVDICVASLQGQMQPLFGLYRKSCLPLLEKSLSRGEYKLQTLIRQAAHQLLPLDVLAEGQPRLFANLNTPEEFEKAGGKRND